MDKGRRNREWLTRLALVIVSGLSVLYLAEIILAFNQRPTIASERIKAAQALGVEFDTLSKYERVQQMRQAGEVVYPRVSPTLLLKSILAGEPERLDIFPLSGVSNVLTIGANENGYYQLFHSDQFGFNNPAEVYEDTIDVVLVGDSYTQGSNVKNDQTIASHLRRANLNVHNIGYAGAGPLIQLATLREYFVAEDQPLVLWFFYEGNDFFNFREERLHPLLMQYVMDPHFTQNLAARQPELDARHLERIQLKELQQGIDASQPKSVGFGLARLKLVALRGLWRQAFDPPVNFSNFSETDAEIELYTTVVMRAQQIVEEAGGELIVVYLPEYDRYGDPGRGKLLNKRNATVRRVMTSVGVPFIDITEVFDGHSDPLTLFPFRLKGHYNAVGYELVAETLITTLKFGR